MKKKSVALLMACVMLLGVAMGGTLAWLTDKTEAVTNTFTDSDINITLTETKPADKTAKMVPGDTIEKDPKVTVEAGSEACWLFVKVEEIGDVDTFLNYTVDSGWTPVDAANTTHQEGVYYKQISAEQAKAGVSDISVLTGDVVTVKDTVKKANMDTIDGKAADGTDDPAEIAARPQLTFTAYAIQSANLPQGTDAAAAWALAIAD